MPQNWDRARADHAWIVGVMCQQTFGVGRSITACLTATHELQAVEARIRCDFPTNSWILSSRRRGMSRAAPAILTSTLRGGARSAASGAPFRVFFDRRRAETSTPNPQDPELRRQFPSSPTRCGSSPHGRSAGTYAGRTDPAGLGSSSLARARGGSCRSRRARSRARASRAQPVEGARRLHGNVEGARRLRRNVEGARRLRIDLDARARSVFQVAHEGRAEISQGCLSIDWLESSCPVTAKTRAPWR